MQTAAPAILKPGVTLDTLPGPRAGDVAGPGSHHLDPRHGADLLGSEARPAGSSTRSTPTRSRRPPTACRRASRRSTSAGRPASFRYLMPDFRARVHRGETFVIAGDRFAIGILARDEPGRAEGRRRGGGPRDGRRLRRQHGRHLPPQRVQPRPARRAEPRGGGRRAGRRRVHASTRCRARSPTRRRARPTTPRAALRRRKTRSAGAAASSRVGRREFRDVGRARAVDRLAGRRDARAA